MYLSHVTQACRVFALLAIGVWLSAPVWAAEKPPATATVHAAYYKAALAIDAGELREALSIAKQMSRSREDRHRVAGEALMARLYLHEDRLKNATRELKDYLDDPKASAQLAHEVQVEIARVMLADNKPLPAMEILNRVSNDEPIGIAKIYAAEGMSDSFLYVKEFDKAITWINFSIKSLDGWLHEEVLFDEDYEDEPGKGNGGATPPPRQKQSNKAKSAFDALRTRLEQKRKRLLDIKTIMEHGLGFYLYREAQVLRFADKHLEALKAYDELIERAVANADNTDQLEKIMSADGFDEKQLLDLPVSPVYGQAARMYRMLCLVELGRDAQAVRDAKLLIKNEPFSPYLGEAHRLLGDVGFERQGDFREAMQHYTDALAWFESFENTREKFDSYKVPVTSYSITAPPMDMREFDEWGNLEWEKPEPDDVVNPLTVHWYLPQQRMMTKMTRSLCHFALGETEEAIADLKIILEVDSRDQQLYDSGMASNYRRLHDGYRSGRLFATKEELDLFNGKMLSALLLAEMHLEAENWAEASSRYERLNKRYGGQMNTNQKAYITLAMGCIEAYQFKKEKAKETLMPFLEEYANSPSFARAIIFLSNYFPPEQEYKMLMGAYERRPKEQYGKEALMRAGQVAHFNRWKARALKCFETLSESEGDNWIGKASRTYIMMVNRDIP